MKLLIVTATNRKNSLTSSVSLIVQGIYRRLGEEANSGEKPNLIEEPKILDLKQIPFKDIVENPFAGAAPCALSPFLKEIAQACGLIIICPEYNGGVPGLIKHFIDHWIYPDSFVAKPVCFIGLGGKFGAFNPISHLQGIFLYRHSFVFPIRVFIQNVSEVLKEGQIEDENINRLLIKQAKNFIKFTTAVKAVDFKF